MPFLSAQEPEAIYLYDDQGRLVRLVDQPTGQSAAYHYDAVGNILSITRENGGLSTPDVISIEERPGDNSYTLTGSNLLGATVDVDIPGVYVSNVRSSDNEVSFRLRSRIVGCSNDGTATITTQAGLIQLPITTYGAGPLTLGRTADGTVAGPEDVHFYCLELHAKGPVVIRVIPDEGSELKPCVALHSDVNGPPVVDGMGCATEVGAATLVDTYVGAGNYFVAVSGAESTTGNFTIKVEPPLVMANNIVGAALPDDGTTVGIAVHRATPIVNTVLPGSEPVKGAGIYLSIPPVVVEFTEDPAP